MTTQDSAPGTPGQNKGGGPLIVGTGVSRRRLVPSPDKAKAWAKQIMQTLVAALILGGAWELLSRLDPSFFPRIIIPPPTEIAQAFVTVLTGDLIWPNLWVTTQETLIAFAIGAGGAFVIGVIISLWKPVKSGVYPLLISIQSTPRSALAPVLIAWFGFGMSSKIALAVLICFFPVLANTVTGLTTVDENAELLMRSMQSSRVQTFWYFRLPNAMPLIFAGLQASLTFALVGAVFGELLGSDQGVGSLIKAASFQLRMDNVFAYLAFLSLVGISLVGIMAFIQRKVTFWSIEEGQEL
ncbi:MAG: ABC transporter permease subunit [Actinobacteria bacterium]|nr:ABC transporter permease subunit [Actinomycetota bacterium]